MTYPGRLLPSALVLGALCLNLPVGQAADSPAPAKPASDLTIYGDLRLRYEWDWDSQNGSGVARTDRDRARFRGRVGFGYKLSSEWSVGARARTGTHQSQGSPHLTFYSSDGTHDNPAVELDRYFVQYKHDTFTAWGGRNGLPFWQQNEMFWDDDVTPTGLAGIMEKKLEQGSLTTTVGAFLLPDGVNHLNGSMAGGQFKYSVPVKPSQFTFAAGLYGFNGKDGARYLRNRNGARDYVIGALSAQWTQPVDGRLFSLGVDFFNNFEHYSATDAAPLSAVNAGQTTGYVFSAVLGQLKQPHDWQVGYYYAHIGTFAVNASYSQDDWARFGGNGQSDITDITGHELRGTYVITKSLNLAARLFLVDAITTVQNGKRFRLDLNWKY